MNPAERSFQPRQIIQSHVVVFCQQDGDIQRDLPLAGFIACIGGFVHMQDAPGFGYTVNRARLDKYTERQLEL